MSWPEFLAAFEGAGYSAAEAARFAAKVHPRPTASGCWLWTGATNSKGYGCLGLRKRPWLAHRLAYTVLVGPIPDGLVVDHVKARGCRHKTCVNPAHLEAVTNDANLGRGNVVWSAAMRPIWERQRREAAARQARRRAAVAS